MSEPIDEFLEELIDKYEDIREHAEGWVEKNMAEELYDDLVKLRRLVVKR